MLNSTKESILATTFFKESNFNEKLVTEKIKKSYYSLKKDAYMKNNDNYRYRAFLQGVIENNQITWIEKSIFFQSSKINSYQGDIERIFPLINPEIRQDIENLILNLNLNLLNQDYSIGCHQIRITVDEKNIGCPAPEGFHQDGYDFVIIIAVAQYNIAGGTTLLRKPKSSEIIYKNILQPYHYLILNDSNVEHYTTPITHLIPHDGYRDVLVITLNKI